MSNFKAIVLNKTGEQFTREVKSIDKSFLIHGDVLVKVDYSDFNYKDGMILKNLILFFRLVRLMVNYLMKTWGGEHQMIL